jgi:hypothetical protein
VLLPLRGAEKEKEGERKGGRRGGAGGAGAGAPARRLLNQLIGLCCSAGPLSAAGIAGLAAFYFCLRGDATHADQFMHGIEIWVRITFLSIFH